MVNLEELKKAALAATPGPWEKCDSYGPNENGTCVSAVERPDLMIASTTGYYGRDGGIANAHFIALANPSAILDMIAQLEATQKELGDLLNQEFQQRLANAEHQLYMKDLAIHNIKASRKAQFRKRLAAEAALSAVQLDATRWRALLSSPAIRILGHAGLQDDKPIDGHYCHFGMEIWSHYEPYYDNKKAGEVITRYADNMIAASLVEGNADAD